MSRAFARAAAVAALALSTSATGASASGTFVQPVHLLHTFHGPTTGKGAFFGWAVSELRDVNGIVSAKASEEEAAGYREWLLSAAQESANAAKEGGFMGWHAERVSEGEQKMLDRLGEVLSPAG